jgi:EAL and modified HD-GYP domain-containing signal transduction protein
LTKFEICVKNGSKLPIRLNALDLETILDALRLLPIIKPASAAQALGALKAFLRAAPGHVFDVTTADLEAACEALASRAQKTTGLRRATIDEALARLTASLLKPESLFAGPAASDESGDLKNVLINRRPIYDGKMKVHAYQPGVHTTRFPDVRGDAGDPRARTAFATVCENLDDIAGNSGVLMSMPYEYVAAGTYEMLPKERVIILLQDCGVDDAFKSLAKLFAQGYRLALSEANESLHPVAGLAEIMQFNLAGLGRQGLQKRVEELRKFKVKFLVEGIETHEEFELCKALGVDLFEGRFLLKPKATTRNVPLSRASVVQLLAELQEPDIRLVRLEEIITQDVALSYKLLRFANSAYVGLRRTVNSIRHAVGLVGVRRIQNWASLLLFSKIDDKPQELLSTAAIRGRMCEQLADSDDPARRATFFTAGLLSVLDALLDLPMAEAVKRLPLAEEITAALVSHTGTLGTALQAVLHYEQGHWDSPYLRQFLTPVLRDSYLESLRWFRTVNNGLLLNT